MEHPDRFVCFAHTWSAAFQPSLEEARVWGYQGIRIHTGTRNQACSCRPQLPCEDSVNKKSKPDSNLRYPLQGKKN